MQKGGPGQGASRVPAGSDAAEANLVRRPAPAPTGIEAAEAEAAPGIGGKTAVGGGDEDASGRAGGAP